MCDEWMPQLELKITPAEFQHLPRNAAYRYDYHEGRAWLNPRPRYYHALLDLPGLTLDGVADVPVRPMVPADWEGLVEVFAGSFATQQPFAGQPPAMRLVAARRSLDREQPLVAYGDQSSIQLAAQLRDVQLTPAAATIRRELERRFLAALEDLPEEDREIIVLRHFEHLSNSEAAEALGLTPPAAGMRHLRAVRRLRTILGEAPSQNSQS